MTLTSSIDTSARESSSRDGAATSSAPAIAAKKSSMVYRYWCEPASAADADLLREQIRLAADYRRELAQIENRSRALWRARNSGVGSSALAEATRAELRAIRRDAALAKSVQGVLHPDEDVVVGRADLPATVAATTVTITAATVVDRLVALGISRGAAVALVEEDAIGSAHYAARRAARGRAVDLGLYWGTYQHAEDGVSASFRATPVGDDVATWYPRGEGCAAVHLQPARPLADDDEWIRIGPIVRHGSEIDKSGRVRPARHREVLLRVGSTGRRPRWAVVHVLMHRAIPAGAVVSWAVVKLRRVGSKSRWTLCVTVGGVPASGRSTDRMRASSAGRESRCAGVDIGWRRVDGGVRIASWWGSDGRSGEVVIPDRVLSADDKADSLRAIRDRNKNALRSEIQAFARSLRAPDLADDTSARGSPPRDKSESAREIMSRDAWSDSARESASRDACADATISAQGSMPRDTWPAVAISAQESMSRDMSSRGSESASSSRGIPGAGPRAGASSHAPLPGNAGRSPACWLVEETRHVHQWLRTSRFVRLIARWREDRVPGDEEVFVRAVAWLKQDRHLWDWEAATRERRRLRVNEQIRLLAVQLTREYGRIGVEAPMVARMVRRPAEGACRTCAARAATDGDSSPAPGARVRCDECRDAEWMRRLAATRVQHAAPARTREEIERFGVAYGAIVVRHDPAYTTMDCSACGHRRTEVGDWSPREIRCAVCGHVEDQDRTAAKNLCRIMGAASDASGRVSSEDGESPASDPLERSSRPGKKLGARRNRRAGGSDRSKART
jgi:hypothetical protein